MTTIDVFNMQEQLHWILMKFKKSHIELPIFNHSQIIKTGKEQLIHHKLKIKKFEFFGNCSQYFILK